MLMALANLDGSFTCTLFAPKKGKNSFERLNNKKEVENYFKRLFPDFFEIVPNLYDQWKLTQHLIWELLELIHGMLTIQHY